MKVLLVLTMLFACSKCDPEPQTGVGLIPKLLCIPQGDSQQILLPSPIPQVSFLHITYKKKKKITFMVTLGVFTAHGKHPRTFTPGLEGSTVGNLTAHGCYSGLGTSRASVDRYRQRCPTGLTLLPRALHNPSSHP